MCVCEIAFPLLFNKKKNTSLLDTGTVDFDGLFRYIGW